MNKKNITISYILSQVILIFLAVIVIYPLCFVIMTSVKSNFDVLTHPFTIHSFKIENYIEAWEIGKIGKAAGGFVNVVFKDSHRCDCPLARRPTCGVWRGAILVIPCV